MQTQKDKSNLGVTPPITDAVKGVANNAGDVVKDLASKVGDATTDAGSYLAHKVEEATTAVGGELKSVAHSMRDKGPHDGLMGNANAGVANTLETFGRELEEHGLSGIADDVTLAIRRHPVPAVLIGVGVGFILARLLSK